MGWGNSNAGDQAVALQKQQQKSIQQATNQINQDFSGFTPQFFQDRATAYENYEEPQLYQQYGQTLAQMQDKLGNQGLTDSSAAQQEQGALQQALSQGQTQIANQGISQAQTLQEQVANEQANLVSQANAANDPLSIAQGALTQAAGFQTPSAFTPIGNMFQNVANTYLGSQLASTYNPNLYASFLSPSGSGGGGGFGGSLPAASTTIQ